MGIGSNFRKRIKKLFTRRNKIKTVSKKSITKNQDLVLMKKIKTYNDGIRKLQKQGYPKNALPPKKSFSKESKKIETNQDYKKTLKSLDRVSNIKVGIVSNKHGLQFNKQYLKEIERENKLRNAKRKRRLDKYDMNNYDDKGKHNVVERSNLLPVNYDIETFTSYKAFNMFVEGLSKETYTSVNELNKLYKENYIKALWKIFGSVDGVQDLVDHVRAINDSTFFAISVKTDLLTIFDVYKAKEKLKKFEQIKSQWETLEKGDYENKNSNSRLRDNNKSS